MDDSKNRLVEKLIDYSYGVIFLAVGCAECDRYYTSKRQRQTSLRQIIA